MLSYFGCDQSQVQRYLTAKSVNEGRSSLLMSAYWKIPLQLLVLMVGVLTFIFYVFHRPPMLFNRVHEQTVRASGRAADYDALEERVQAGIRRAPAGGAPTGCRAPIGRRRHGGARPRRPSAPATPRSRAIRARASGMVRQTTGDASYTDVNYVFPTFIVDGAADRPGGTVDCGDHHRGDRHHRGRAQLAGDGDASSTSTSASYRPGAPDEHYLRVSKVATAFWGLFASVVAVYASSLGSLIEVVNRFGSFFYGSILGVFMLAILTRRATGTGAFVGLIAGMSAVAAVAFGRPEMSFLWHNVIGAVVVFVVGLALSATRTPDRGPTAAG